MCVDYRSALGGVLYTSYQEVGIVCMGYAHRVVRACTAPRILDRMPAAGSVGTTRCRAVCTVVSQLLMGYVGRDIAVLHVVHACAHGAPWAGCTARRGSAQGRRVYPERQAVCLQVGDVKENAEIIQLTAGV